MGRNGIHYLDEGRIEGQDPLPCTARACRHRDQRLDAIEHVGDLAVISMYDPGDRRVAAFERADRRPRRLGGPVDRAVPAVPLGLELDLAPLIGAPMVYQQLRHWMERELGMTFGPRDATAKPGAASTTDPAVAGELV